MQNHSVNIRDEFHFSDIHRSMNAMGPVQSSHDALRRPLTLHEPIAFIIDEYHKNGIHFLIKLSFWVSI